MRIVIADPPAFTLPYDHHLARALSDRGHDVHLVVSPLRFGAPPVPAGYHRHEPFFPVSGRVFRAAPRSMLRLPLKALELAPGSVRFLRLVERLDPDIVHVQWLPLPRWDVRWLRALRHHRPVVLTVHEGASSRRPERAWRAIAGLVDLAVVHTARAEAAMASVGVPPARVARFSHPVFRDETDVSGPPEGNTLLFFGLLRTYKGLDVLIRALPEIRARVRDVRLIVAGYPLEPAGRLRDLAASLDVADIIEWQLRHVPEADVTRLLGSATIVVLPYRRAEASGVLATALGRGRPAVVTDVGSLGEIVRAYCAGRVVPPSDPASLAEACAALLCDRAELHRAARGARAACQALSWSGAALWHEKRYTGVIHERARADDSMSPSDSRVPSG